MCVCVCVSVRAHVCLFVCVCVNLHECGWLCLHVLIWKTLLYVPIYCMCVCLYVCVCVNTSERGLVLFACAHKERLCVYVCVCVFQSCWTVCLKPIKSSLIHNENVSPFCLGGQSVGLHGQLTKDVMIMFCVPLLTDAITVPSSYSLPLYLFLSASIYLVLSHTQIFYCSVNTAVSGCLFNLSFAFS